MPRLDRRDPAAQYSQTPPAERRQNQIVLVSLAVVFLWVALATYADIRFTAAPSFTSADFLAGSLCYALTGFLAVIAFHRQQWGWVIIVWNCVSFGLAMLLSVAL